MYVLELIKDMREKQPYVLNSNNAPMFQMCRKRIAVDFPVLPCAFKLHEPHQNRNHSLPYYFVWVSSSAYNVTSPDSKCLKLV